MRVVVRWLILFVVLFTGLAGLYNGPRDFANAKNLGERILAFAVTLYGVAGVVSFIALLRRKLWVMVPFLIWAGAATFAASFATAFYSTPEMMWISAAASGGSCVVLLMLILVQVNRESSTY
jgi:FtsH-binding integral membrane protein